MSSSNNPLVSVIVPNYNHARYLETRIKSILAQDYQNIEIIILDDKSTDNSLDIINKYKEHSLVSQIIINNINSGSPFKQWEKGIMMAKGEIIWIAESDDSCSFKFLSSLIEEYYRKNAILAFCKSSIIDSKGEIIQEDAQEYLHGDYAMEGISFIKDFMTQRNAVINASSVIFSKDVALTINNNYTSFKGAGDWLFWIFIMEKGNVLFLNKKLNYCRRHSNNTTDLYYNNGVNYFETKRIYDYLLSKNIITKDYYNGLRNLQLRFILNNSFNSNKTKKELLHLWKIDTKFYIKEWLLKYYSKLFS